MHHKGLGVERDYKEAEKWFRPAAERGSPQAQFMLGLMLYYGEGMPEDKEEALSWFRKAAEKGHNEAQFFLS
jgi:TPR repeat protein